MEIDSAVGEILDLLYDLQIQNETIAILTSDNGPALVSKTEGKFGLITPQKNHKSAIFM